LIRVFKSELNPVFRSSRAISNCFIVRNRDTQLDPLDLTEN